MWHFISCYLIGHDYSICCEAGAIYLRCANCGRRSQGWDLHDQHQHLPEPHVHGHETAMAPARHH